MSYPMRICIPGDYRLFTEVAHFRLDYNHYKGYYEEQGAENYIENGKMWCSAPVPLFKEFFFENSDTVYISFDAKFDNDTDYIDLIFLITWGSSNEYAANDAFCTYRLYKDYTNRNTLKYTDYYAYDDVFNYKSYRKNTSNERHFLLKVVNEPLNERVRHYLYCDYIQFQQNSYTWRWGYNSIYNQSSVGVAFNCNNSNVKISNIIITNTELEFNESCINLEVNEVQTDEYCTYNSETGIYTSTEKNNGINITFNSINVKPTFINCELIEDTTTIKNKLYFNSCAVSFYENNEEICKKNSSLNIYKNKNLLPVKQWTQPVLTANGTIGVSDFACQSGGGAESNAYSAFDSDSSSYVNRMNPDAWLMFYVKDEIEITGITVHSPSTLPYSGKFQVSTDDGTTWTDVGTWEDTALSNTYAIVEFNEGITSVTGHYFRLYSTGKSYNKSSNADIGNVKITAYKTSYNDLLQYDISDLTLKFNFE